VDQRCEDKYKDLCQKGISLSNGTHEYVAFALGVFFLACLIGYSVGCYARFIGRWLGK
jgi:hypothetical protein